MTITGSCLCKAVKINITAEPIAARTCWCRRCQYLAAGNATVNVAFPSDTITIIGEVKWYDTVADSGNNMSHSFCPNCGTGIAVKRGATPDIMIVRAGVLDNPSAIAPKATIWTATAPDWAHFNPDLPQHTGQLPIK